MLIISIVGNRPNFIKLAPVAEEIDKAGIEHAIIHTGQHYDYNMSDIFFAEFNIMIPKYNLDVGSGTHAEQTGKIMIALEPVIEKIKPDVVLVYGDTNTTLAAALTARKLCIPVAHVEAGCRVGDQDFPEEINRVVTDHLSQLHFCPSEHTKLNLSHEGIEGYETGDVMVDVIRKIEHLIPERSIGTPYYVTTIHRNNNTDIPENLQSILDGLGCVKVPIFFPIHPRTRKMINRYDITIPKNVETIKPVNHMEMLTLVKNADCVITDSGGIQKEAFLLHTPCITVRPYTEWPETVSCGWNRLVNPNELQKILTEQHEKSPNVRAHPFGTGDAAKKIVDILERWC